MSIGQIHIVHGDKGGVGKSMFASALLDILLAKRREVVLVDADMRNNDVAETYGAHVPTKSPDLRARSGAGWGELVEFIAEYQSHDVVISMPGNVGSEIGDGAEYVLSAFAELGRSMKLYFLLDSGAQSTNLLRLTMDVFGNKRIVAVRNERFGSIDTFALWNASKTRKRLLSDGGAEIVMPELGAYAVQATAKAHPPRRYSDETLAISVRLMVRHWLTRLASEIATVEASSSAAR